MGQQLDRTQPGSQPHSSAGVGHGRQSLRRAVLPERLEHHRPGEHRDGVRARRLPPVRPTLWAAPHLANSLTRVLRTRAVGLSGFGGIVGRFSRDYRVFELKTPIIPLPNPNARLSSLFSRLSSLVSLLSSSALCPLPSSLYPGGRRRKKMTARPSSVEGLGALLGAPTLQISRMYYIQPQVNVLTKHV